RDDPECGARRGVLRRRLATACPGRPGTPPVRHYDLAARSSLHGSGGNAGDGSAAPGEKPPRWSAERRASRVMGRKAPRKRLACRVISAFTRAFDARWHAPRVLRTHPNVSRRSAHPSIGVSEAKSQSPDAKCAAGTRECVVFKVVSRDARPHPEERALRKTLRKLERARARVSKDEDVRLGSPSCFETHRSALGLWKRLRSHPAATLLVL